MSGTQHDAQTAATLEAIRAFDRATSRRDVDAMVETATDDVVWETTTPPDGERHRGKAAVRAALEGLFSSTNDATFEIEEVVAMGDRAFFTWTYRWKGPDGTPGHVRGVDLARVRDGKIAEMLAYVKG
jgi:ketosteroid isomerase-like protein